MQFGAAKMYNFDVNFLKNFVFCIFWPIFAWGHGLQYYVFIFLRLRVFFLRVALNRPLELHSHIRVCGVLTSCIPCRSLASDVKLMFQRCQNLHMRNSEVTPIRFKLACII